MFCIYCGTRIPDKGVFCPACGSGNLKRIGRSEYLCEHCGSRFFAREPDGAMSREEEKAKLLALFAEAKTYADRGDYQAELIALSKGMELVPEDGTLLLKLGRASSRLGLVQEAMDYYRKAAEVSPHDPIVYVNQGVEYMKQEMAAEARPLFEKGIAMIEADPMSASTADAAVSYGNYAFCIGKLGDLAGARKYLTIAKKKGCNEQTLDYFCKALKIRV